MYCSFNYSRIDFDTVNINKLLVSLQNDVQGKLFNVIKVCLAILNQQLLLLKVERYETVSGALVVYAMPTCTHTPLLFSTNATSWLYGLLFCLMYFHFRGNVKHYCFVIIILMTLSVQLILI